MCAFQFAYDLYKRGDDDIAPYLYAIAHISLKL